MISISKDKTMLENCTQRLTWQRHSRKQFVEHLSECDDRIDELVREIRDILYTKAKLTHKQVIKKDDKTFMICGAKIVSDINYLVAKEYNGKEYAHVPTLLPLNYFKGCK